MAKGLQKKEIKRRAKTLLSVLGYEAFSLSVLLTDDKEIRALNKEYRGKDKATDVLSFPLLDKKSLVKELGDLVVSVPTMKRQAREFGVSVEEEFLRLLIHGVLHLVGYDHEGVKKSEAEKMRRMEKRLFGMMEQEACLPKKF